MRRLLLFAVLFAPTAARADFNVRDWRFVRTLQTPAPSADSNYETLILDAAAFDGTQPSLADLRMVDNGNDEVPYRLTVERSRQSRATVRASMLNLSHSGPATSFVLDLKQGRIYRTVQHNAVAILTKSHDFRADVKIEASPDGTAWEVIRDKAVIFDVETDYRASHLTVSYPDSTRRYLRISVKPEKGGPLDIQGGSVSRDIGAATIESEWATARAVRREEGKTTVWDVDMGFDNVPVSRVAIVTDARNFQRPMRITASDKGADGVERRSTLWSGAVWRFALPGVSNEGLSV